MIKRIRKAVTRETEKETKTQYEYEITPKGEWKCLRCDAIMKYIDEVEEHHNAHIGE